MLRRSALYADASTCLRSAGAICRYMFSTHVGPPGKTKLDELISQLYKQGHLPIRLVQPFVTVQKYDNFGSQSQEDCEEINCEYITPCVAALSQITKWFFLDYLKTELPKQLKNSLPRIAPASVSSILAT